MKKIHVIINGKKIEARTDQTVLQVVRENNLDEIPTLCHDPRVESFSSCFLCVVEVKGMSKLVPSCSTFVTDGMDITTNSPRIMESRKSALELLLSNHYADCIGPCTNNCPANVDAQSYIALISRGKVDAALRLIKQNNPLPLSIGRVCVRNCETSCRRELVEEAVSINGLKRYVADIDARHKWVPEIKKNNHKRIAVIGGGPAGLTCAYYLRLEGYNVTIFEKLPKLGGMLRYGIPEYRLPKNILDDEISWITGLGIDVRTNVDFGTDITTEQLLEEGYHSIFISIGTQNASSMRLPHEEDTEGIYKGVAFLREMQLKGNPELPGTVIIVGGGNTAIDAARNALRCGASDVKIVYRRSIKEMPAHHEEVQAAIDEGVDIQFLTNPSAILREDGKLKGIECLKMELKEDDPGKRPRPVPIEGSEFTIPCDHLIGAIGQQADTAAIEKIDGLELERWGTILADPETMETSREKIFAGGDIVSGPFTAISAISHGKKAAIAIDEYCRTGRVEKPAPRFLSFKHKFHPVPESELSHIPPQKREKMPELPFDRRKGNFDEVELGYSAEQVQHECGRCLECGCDEYNDCRLRIYADEYRADISPVMGEVRKFDTDSHHPFITLDPNKCINCGRCVRTCSKIMNVSALGFVNRGFKSVVKPAMEKRLLETNCISCGNCIDVCPTGAITEKYHEKILGTLPKENRESICHFCSLGCHVNYRIIDDDLFFVHNDTGEVENSHNNGYLCTKGRFGHRYLLEKERLLQPMVKNGQKLVPSDWDTAIKKSVAKIEGIIQKHGPDSIAIFASPKLSNEELYLIQKFGRTGLKTGNIASFSQTFPEIDNHGLDGFQGITVSSSSFDDLNDADVIVGINANLSTENLLMEQKIKEAQERGSTFVLISSSEIKITKFADLWVESKKGSNTALLNGLSREIIRENRYTDDKDISGTEGFKEMLEAVSPYTAEKVTGLTGIDIQKYETLVRLLSRRDAKVVFIYHMDSPREKSHHDLRAIGNLLLMKNLHAENSSGIILLRDHVNSQGLMDMGIHPGFLPGYVKSTDAPEDDILKKITGGDIKGLLVFGEDPLVEMDHLKYLNNIEFLLVQDLVMTHTAREADIVLPASSYIESSGTYTGCDRTINRVTQIFPPKSGQKNWEILCRLAGAFPGEFTYTDENQIFNEIKETNRFYNGTDIGQRWGGAGFATGGHFDLPDRKFLPCQVKMSTYLPQNPSMIWSENFFKNKIKNKLVL